MFIFIHKLYGHMSSIQMAILLSIKSSFIRWTSRCLPDMEM